MGSSIVAEKLDGNACITTNDSVVFAVANNLKPSLKLWAPDYSSLHAIPFRTWR